MAAVESQMLPLGTKAPAFTLPDPDGELHSLANSADAYLVMFICNHCPFVKHVRDELARLGRDYGGRNVAIYAINSNDITTHPGDSPEKMKEEAEAWGYPFPYLYDADQSAAKAYRAACTPDFFVFDRDQLLVYRGQLDDSRPSNSAPVDGRLGTSAGLIVLFYRLMRRAYRVMEQAIPRLADEALDLQTIKELIAQSSTGGWGIENLCLIGIAVFWLASIVHAYIVGRKIDPQPRSNR